MDAKKVVVSLLGSAVCNMQTVGGKQTVYIVPVGKIAQIFFFVIRNPTATLLGGSDYDFGSGAAANTWRQTVTLVSMTTAVTDYMVIPSIAAVPVKYTHEVAGAEIGIKPITGSTGAANATVEVWGRLLDA